jgi:hypothetical protein
MKRDILCSKCGGHFLGKHPFRHAGHKYYGADQRDNPPSSILMVSGYAISEFLCDHCNTAIMMDDFCFARSIYNKRFSNGDELRLRGKDGKLEIMEEPALAWYHDYITQKQPDSFEEKLKKL